MSCIYDGFNGIFERGKTVKNRLEPSSLFENPGQHRHCHLRRMLSTKRFWFFGSLVQKSISFRPSQKFRDYPGFRRRAFDVRWKASLDKFL